MLKSKFYLYKVQNIQLKLETITAKVNNLGVIIDKNLNLSEHTNEVWKQSFYQLGLHKLYQLEIILIIHL